MNLRIWYNEINNNHPMSFQNESFVFLLGLAIFFLLALWFLSCRGKSKYHGMALSVAAITILSYGIAFDGTLAQGALGETPIYYLRWMFYVISCSLLMVTISGLLKTKKGTLIPVLVLNGLVMLSGAAAAVIESPGKWLVFGLGVVFFLWQLMLLLDVPASKDKQFVMRYIFAGWALFPVVFIFAPEGLGLLSNMVAAIFYLTLDVLTKGLFYIQLITRD